MSKIVHKYKFCYIHKFYVKSQFEKDLTSTKNFLHPSLLLELILGILIYSFTQDWALIFVNCPLS